MFRALALLLLCCSGAALALDSVTLQLKWRHQFQFAGYYAALEKGYYREAGLDVKLVEATPQTDVVAEVGEGRAQFGVGTSDLLLARRRVPVVALAVIFQHSPLILLASSDKVSNLHQLAGREVMVEAHSEELFAYLRSEGLPPEKLKILPHSQTPRDLIEGRVAAMSAYSTTEPYLLRKAGLRTIEFSPRAGGIDFYPLALIMIDLDRFKDINDSHGHAAGDEVLRRLADTLRGAAREGDIACRYGGEEFIVILPGLPLAAALEKAEAWRIASADFRIEHEGATLRVTLSVGVAVFPEHGTDVDTLLQRADAALYCSKNAGRNCVTCYTPAVEKGEAPC